MAYMIGIGEAANPILTIIPIVLMGFSGYAIGIIISKVRKVTPIFSRDLIYGNVVVNFLFLSGFIIFGVLTSAANGYFAVFTYILVGLSIIGAYFLLKKFIMNVTNKLAGVFLGDKSRNVSMMDVKSLLVSDSTTIFILFGISLFVTLLVYQATIIYYHPIYSEYDSIYRFLPISKSILLGNGLNHDFYLGSDVIMRHPPFIQALNAWLIHSFEFSSVRMYPFYYVLFAAILVYSLTRNVLTKTKTSNSESSFFGLIAGSAFLITPALLVVSSRFSLQQDLGFIFMLTASFYFLSDIVRHDKPAKTSLIMLSASLALMALTREIGLVIAVGIFFLVPAIKYTESNLKLRGLFTVLSFLLLYVLILKDLFEVGFIYGTTIRLTVLLLSNLAVFYILAQLKNQNKFSSLITPVSNFKYIVPLVIPIIFIVSNLIIFGGPFPIFTFSGKFNEFLSTYREIFDISNPLYLDLTQTLQSLPRIDILFISVAMGSFFIFIKLVGFGRLIRHLKNNYEYSLVLILLIFLLVTWSFLLQSGFEFSDIRHVLYFVPLFSVILVMGMKIGKESPYNKVYCYGLIVFATFYFLHFNLFIWNYQNNFGGFWVEPNKGSLITWVDVIIGAVIMGVLILLEIGGQKIFSFSRSYTLRRYIIYAFVVLLCIQVAILFNSGIMSASPQKMDRSPPSKWETNVIEVIDYLKSAENGNVLAARAPAIPFFTNRTSLDLFNPQTLAYNISSLLFIENSSIFKEKIADMGIRYIVLPNQNNSLYYLVQNLMAGSKLVDIINTDGDFDKIRLENFDIYKYNVASHKINLLDDERIWKPRKDVTLSEHDGNLNISVISNQTHKVKKDALLKTRLNLPEGPLLLSLTYASNSSLGTGTFKVGIADRKENKILFSSLLNNTSGNLTNQTFILPKNIGGAKPLEFRLYIFTDGPGKYFLNFKRIHIAYS